MGIVPSADGAAPPIDRCGHSGPRDEFVPPKPRYGRWMMSGVRDAGWDPVSAIPARRLTDAAGWARRAKGSPDGKVIRVAAIGASVLASYNSYYPKFIDRNLRSDLIEVHPEGRGGETMGGLLGLDTIYGERFERMKDILDKGYDEIILDVEVNDFASGRTAEDIEAKIEKLCEMSMEAGVRRIVLVETTPWNGFKKWTPEKASEALRFNSRLRHFARGLTHSYTERGCGMTVEVVRIYDAVKDEESPDRLRYPRLYPHKVDWYHPSKEGLEIMADAVTDQAYPELATCDYRNAVPMIKELKREASYLERRLEHAMDVLRGSAPYATSGR